MYLQVVDKTVLVLKLIAAIRATHSYSVVARAHSIAALHQRTSEREAGSKVLAAMISVVVVLL
eukprot:10075-Heterococcus_DN1.PRE.2